MPIEQPPPEVLALVIADHIYRDEPTGRLFILGTRSAFGAVAFPFPCTSLAVYASMIDGHGETALFVRLIDVDEAREPVLEHETTVNFLDPTEEMEVVFHLEDLVFPEPGDYRLQIHAAGQFLRERRLLIIPLENPGRP